MDALRFAIALAALVLYSGCSAANSEQAVIPDSDVQKLVRFERNLREFLAQTDVRFEKHVINQRLQEQLTGDWKPSKSNAGLVSHSYWKGQWTVAFSDDRAIARFVITADFDHGSFASFEISLRDAPRLEVLEHGISMDE